MRVVLAGFNIDADLVQRAVELGLPRDQLTPETLAAAYARISRNPAPVDELRRAALLEVAKARASNEQIVFGMGHASVAEHAVFNFDLMGISRLAIEAVEQHRLCSYTEKSQRYIRLQDDVVFPEELDALGLKERFRELIELQNRTYHLLYEKLREEVFARNPELAADRSQRRTLEGWAKEDARYVTALAVEGQLGMTVNARTLEHMIRRLAAHPLSEVRSLGATLNRLAREAAPSLIRYTEPSLAGEESGTLGRLAAELYEEEHGQTLPGEAGAVQLIEASPEGDRSVAAALLQEASGAPWTACLERVRAIPEPELAGLLRAALRRLGPHDSPPRAFELASARFDLVVSASCFAQLKRHRMATLLPQRYDPSLGFTMPEAVERVGLTGEFRRVMVESTRLYETIAAHNPDAACYALTQAHRRRVLLQMNARELYHFSRLRQDRHAQWDIRRVAERMLNLARQALPHTLQLACGKDAFVERRRELFPDG